MLFLRCQVMYIIHPTGGQMYLSYNCPVYFTPLFLFH